MTPWRAPGPPWSHSAMQMNTAVDFCSFSVSMVWKNGRPVGWENSWQRRIKEQAKTKWLGVTKRARPGRCNCRGLRDKNREMKLWRWRQGGVELENSIKVFWYCDYNLVSTGCKYKSKYFLGIQKISLLKQFLSCFPVQKVLFSQIFNAKLKRLVQI